MDTSEAWDILENEFNVSEDTLRIVTSINGYSIDTMNDILYAVAGYNDFEQLKEGNEEDE